MYRYYVKKKNMKRLIILFSGLLVVTAVKAQDVHFTQFDKSPLLMSPSNAGLMVEDHRANVNYRNQWSSVGAPYRTIGFSYDGAFFRSNNKSSWLGAGINFYNDKAGDLGMGITQVDLNVSGIVKLNNENNLSVGASAGYAQRKVDAAAAQWENQWDGSGFNSGLASNESSSYSPTNYFDLGGGISWMYNKGGSNLSSKDELSILAGVAVYHINKPVMEVNTSEKLNQRISAFADMSFGINNTKWYILPGVMYQQQGKLSEINIKLLAKYQIKAASKITGNIKPSSISFGTFVRIGDAIMPTVRYEYNGLGAGVSYDFNISSLDVASKSQGGVEISLFYRFKPAYGSKL